MDAIKAIETRTSARSYAAKPLTQDQLNALVKAAQSAPKAGNFHISVITNGDLLTEINDKALTAMKNSDNDFLMGRAALPGYAPLYGAPLLLLFSAPPQEHYAAVNCACAATAAVIAASGMELGSCYVVTPTLALAANPQLNAKAQIPQGYQAMCGVLAGYKEGEKFTTDKQPLDNVTYVA